MLTKMIKVVEVAVTMRAMLVVIMKVMMIVKIKDEDGGSKFDCVDDVDGCDSFNDNGVGDGSVNINVDGDADKMVVIKTILILKLMMEKFYANPFGKPFHNL